MVSKDLIGIGNKIMLRLVKHGGVTCQEEQTTYVSQFLQWSEDHQAQIAMPIHQGQFVLMNLRDEYLLNFYTSKGLYQCRAVVMERKRLGNIAVVEMKLISDLEKFQRRQYYRMECVLPMQFAALTEEQSDWYLELKNCMSAERKEQLRNQLDAQKIQYQEATILDISGGGMRFNSSQRQTPGTMLSLRLSFDEELKEKIPVLLAKVLLSEPLQNREEVYDNRIEFLHLSNAERERIICYIFKEERSKRRREL